VLSTYRQALSVPGSVRFSSTGFVARLPMAMVSLGIVLLVSERTGSYAVAGILSAAFQLPAALGAVVTSRWADRLGQHRVLPWLAAANALLLVTLVIAVEAGAPLLLQLLAAAGAGVTQPAIGAMVRARWSAATTDGRALRGGFALEGVVDEIVFSIGPPLTAMLAVHVALPLPLIVAAALGLAGTIALALQRRSEPPVHRDAGAHDGARRPGALAHPGMPTLFAAAIATGSVFGSYEVSVVAFTAGRDAAGASGVIIGLWALSSMVGGLWFGARHWRMGLDRQMVMLPAILTLTLLPAPFMPTVVTLSLVTILGGFAVAPTLITLFTLTQRLVPGRQMTEGLTWTASGLALGFALGTAVAGFVVDDRGTSIGFVLSIAGAAATVVAAVVGRRRFADAPVSDEESAPPVVPVNDPVPGPTPGSPVDERP